MNDVQAKLGRTLLKSLLKLRQQKGEVSLEDVGSIFVQMSSTFNPATSEADQFMHEEIRRLASYINDAKSEIFSISQNEKSEKAITDASSHLDEVIKATEQASTSIMDAADIIQNNAAGIGGEKEQKIIEATNQIYEACNFQDITGQRINKVIKLLANIEERITRLVTLFGATEEANTSTDNNNSNNVLNITLPTDDKDLLNGPQLSSNASSQAEIDQLFASLGGKK